MVLINFNKKASFWNTLWFSWLIGFWCAMLFVVILLDIAPKKLSSVCGVLTASIYLLSIFISGAINIIRENAIVKK